MAATAPCAHTPPLSGTGARIAIQIIGSGASITELSIRFGYPHWGDLVSPFNNPLLAFSGDGLL
jgi:hypothetical protein